MSDLYYKVVRAIGRPCFAVSSRPVVLGLEHVPMRGPCLIASTHESPYDIPLLIRHVPRLVDFVSITEVFRNPLMAWFYGSMNAFPLERSRPDVKTVRIILDRLQAGRVVAMFPEGRIPPPEQSVLATGTIRRGLGRLAQLTNVPVVPCVVLGSGAYRRPASWLPLRCVRYGMIFGQPLQPGEDPQAFEMQYIQSVQALAETLQQKMPRV